LRREVQLTLGATLFGVAAANCAAGERQALPNSPQVIEPGWTPDPPGADASIEAAARVDAGALSDASASADADADAGIDRHASVVPVYGDSYYVLPSAVVFEPNSVSIDAEGEQVLARVKAGMDFTGCDVTIDGFASPEEAASAEWLSKKRAEAVRRRLIELGVPKERLAIRPRGVTRAPPR